MQSDKRKYITAVQVVLAVLMAVGIAWLAFKMVGYSQAQRIYDDIGKAYATETNDDSPIDFAALRAEYPDVVGWLKMDDMDVSYPVVQAEDNDYFLSHDPSGQTNIDGSIYLDYRCKSLDKDRYSIIYGHNMMDESMFGQLDEYTSEEFYKGHAGTFHLYTPDASYKYKIFAVNIVDPADDIYQMGFTNTQTFAAFAEQMKNNSMYDTGVDVAGSDYVITLSTCSASNRLVLSAKRM